MNLAPRLFADVGHRRGQRGGGRFAARPLRPTSNLLRATWVATGALCVAAAAGQSTSTTISGAGLPAQAATPSFSPGAGVYTYPLTVTLASATSGASIIYTTDGTLPAESSGVITNGALLPNGGSVSIVPPATLSAIAFKDGEVDSGLTVSGYTRPTPTTVDTSSAAAPILHPAVVGLTPILNIIYNFPGIDYNGETPVFGGEGEVGSFAALVQGSDGNFYGTTGGDNFSNSGTIFRVTPKGTLTTLITFNDNDVFPQGSLVQGSDGNFYGATEGGGTNGDSTIFKMTPAGVFTILVSFTGANGADPTGLVQGSDGNFYGTTLTGGSTYVSARNSGDGTVFKMTPAGVVTTLASFTGANGANPVAALVQGSDGNFYGTTSAGGSTYVDSLNRGDGTVFEVTPAGVLTTLASFTGANGAGPTGLVQGSDGNFYGTTSAGGSTYVDSLNRGDGTVFKITSTGTLTTLASFAGANGSDPTVALVQGTDGNFYGTTLNGGSTYVDSLNRGNGTIFMMTLAGSLTTLVSFTAANEMGPTGLVQGSDGNFYGATGSGVVTSGVIFQLVLKPQVATPSASASGGGGGGGAFDDWFIALLALAGLLRWWRSRP
jgi:uncharacterized repeat protein (TIGR03803 family)